MGRWRSRVLYTLIIYFAGFATAIYALAPAPDAKATSGASKAESRKHSDAGFKSEEFALAFNSGMRKCIGFAEEKAVKAGEFIKAKLAERQKHGGK